MKSIERTFRYYKDFIRWNIRGLSLGPKVNTLELAGVQQKLSKLGYITDPLEFKDGLSKFQINYGLEARGGILDFETYFALVRACCRVPDGDTARMDPCRWPGDPGQPISLTFRFAKGAKDFVKTAVRSAADEWQRRSGVVTFIELQDESMMPSFMVEGPGVISGDLLIQDQMDSFISSATFPCETVSKVCHFDDVFVNWGDCKAKSFTIVNFALHEIGHTLGLVHSCLPDDIMYNGFNEGDDCKAVSGSDISALKKLYGFS